MFPVLVAGGGGGGDATPPGGRSGRGSHQLADSTACPRKWWLRYRRGLVKISEPAWRLAGTTVHLGLAYHYASRMDPRPAWLDKPYEQALVKAASGDIATVELTSAICDQYAARYAQEDWVPTHVEHEFRVSLGTLIDSANSMYNKGLKCPRELRDEMITGRADLLVQYPDGRYRVVDHKTTSATAWRNPNKLPKWKQETGPYRVPWQSMIYLWLARHDLGQAAVAGFVINRISRKEGPDTEAFDMDRHALRIPQVFYEDVPRICMHLVKEEIRIIELAKASKKIPLGYPFACDTKFGPCDYIEYCCARNKRERAALIGVPVEPLVGEGLPHQQYAYRRR